MLLRYTLQQQFHQDVKSLHTDAWLEHTNTAGQRALQVGDDPKWVVIASSGLQRGAANVGAGGMMKKNLPVGCLSQYTVCLHMLCGADPLLQRECMYVICCCYKSSIACMHMACSFAVFLLSMYAEVTLPHGLPFESK